MRKYRVSFLKNLETPGVDLLLSWQNPESPMVSLGLYVSLCPLPHLTLVLVQTGFHHLVARMATSDCGLTQSLQLLIPEKRAFPFPTVPENVQGAQRLALLVLCAHRYYGVKMHLPNSSHMKQVHYKKQEF